MVSLMQRILGCACIDVVVSLNYCSQNGGNLYRAPYYNRNPNIGPRIDSNLGQSPHVYTRIQGEGLLGPRNTVVCKAILLAKAGLFE